MFAWRLAPARTASRTLRKLYSTKGAPEPAIPYTQSCPSPTCSCAAEPEGLDIDRKAPLLHTMAPYNEHVVICTGKEDWSSRIEDEPTPAGEFIRELKKIVGRGGPGFNPYNPLLLTTSSHPPSPHPNQTSVLLFPSFLSIPSIPPTPSSLTALTTAYLAHPNPPPNQDPTSPNLLIRNPSLATTLPPPTPITTPVVLICSHATRDSRCGILGPILRSAFEAEFARRGVEARVECVSHVGGHKFAGNVIVYLPPGGEIGSETEAETKERNPLLGSGIWYGRVGVGEVEGIVGETVLGGRVIFELLRGGVGRGVDGERVDIGRVLERQMGREGVEGVLKLKPRIRG